MPAVKDNPMGLKAPRRHTPPTKRTLNLMIREKKPFRPSRWIPGVLAVLLLAGLFGKFAVYDRYAALNRAEAELQRGKDQLAATQRAYADYAQVEEQYNHYSYAGFDRTIADRLDVMDILERHVFPVSRVTRLSVSGKTVTMTLSGLTLGQVSELVEKLKAEPLVEAVTVSTAGFNEKDAIPTANMTLTLADADKLEEGEGE